jgi:hypothetical protein
LELSRQSVRSAGLAYNEAASFSLKPALILKAFLPPLLWEPPFSEFVAYAGLTGLALAGVGVWAVLRRRPPVHGGSTSLARGRALILLAFSGAFLAFGAYNPVYYLLYKLVPGFDLFRAPARWLLLYSLGTALLAGVGLEALARLRSLKSQHARRWAPAIALLLVLELFLAGRRLAYNQPTSPAAFDSLRTAPAHLLADQAAASPAEPFRFLSLSDITYDPGDLADLQLMYREELPDEAIYDLTVATKMKEVLAFNLPLKYRLSSVDGYDGGLLPIADYVKLEELFLTKDEIWPDGRLRQQLRRVPPARLLSLLNVKYVITDKSQDVWIDDVFYDLEHTVPLGEVALTDMPDFEATHLGVVSYLTGTIDLADGAPIAQVTISDTLGSPFSTTLRAGEDTAEGLYRDQEVSHSQARVGHIWRDNLAGSDYVSVLDLGRKVRPAAISLRSLLPGQQVHLRGLSLIDETSGTSRALSVDPAYRLVHSGDVKVYENLAVLPRAFLVQRARLADEYEAVLDVLRSGAFDPSSEVVISSGQEISSSSGSHSSVTLLLYEPETIRMRVSLDCPAYLVLTDTYYPGWKATVDGKPAPIRAADLYFRAIALEPGVHLVSFRYNPLSVSLGLGVGLPAWLLWTAATAIAVVRTGRKRIIEV